MTPARLLNTGLVLLALLAQAGWAQGFEWADDGAGPTCENHLSMGSLAWSRPGGEWVDAMGALQGNAPFASADVPERPGVQRVVFDVTQLLQAHRADTRRSVTLMLRAEPSALRGQADFASRESRQAATRPALDITLADGTRANLAPAADTFLDCSTLRSLGAEPVLSVRGDRSSLLRYGVPAGAAVVKAELVLHSVRQYAGGARVGVYRARMPGADGAMQPRLGLASRYLLDRGIAADPAVYFADGFDRWFWPLGWRDLALRGDSNTVSRDAEGHFDPVDGNALRTTLRKGSHLALDLRYNFARHGRPDPEEAYLRYYLRLADGWNPSVDGGKLPGLAGTYGKGGWGNRKANGRNGWSMRAAFAARPAGAPSVQGLTALGTVACHARIEDPSCEHWGWGLGPGALLENNRWYSIEQHVRLNTPGRADGLFEAWVDGRLVFRKADVIYRDVPELRIESAWFNVYHGGTETAPVDLSLYIDNVVLAREYIGPLAGVPLAGPASR